MTDVKPHPPTDDIRILIDGDICDAACPAIAYVRIYIHHDGDLLSTLHLCAHHWHTNAERLTELQRQGVCTIRDETRWAGT